MPRDVGFASSEAAFPSRAMADTFHMLGRRRFEYRGSRGSARGDKAPAMNQATPRSSTWLRYLYLALCIPGALWPGYHIASGTTGAEMLRGMFATHSVSVIVSDLLLVALIAVLWMVVEARRLGMRWSVYLFFACAAPFSVVFPLFLYRREITLDRGLHSQRGQAVARSREPGAS